MTQASNYWCERHIVVGVEGPDGYVESVIEKPFARVGSHRQGEVVLDHPSVPWRALYFHATDAGVICLPLGEADAKAGAVRYVEPEEMVELGPYRVSARLAPVESPEAGAEDEPEMATRPPREAPEVLVSTEDRELGRCRITRQLVVVGRQTPSLIRVGSSMISAVHCALYWDGERLWAIDLLSRNGTQFEGQPIEAAELPPGSALQVGPIRLTHTTAEMPEASQPAEPDIEAEQPSVTAELGEVASEATDVGPEDLLPDHEVEPSEGERQEESPLDQRRAELDGARAELVEQTAAQQQREQVFHRQVAQWESAKKADAKEVSQRRAALDEEAGQLVRKWEELGERVASWEEETRQREAELEGRREQIRSDGEALDARRRQTEKDCRKREGELAKRIARHEATEASLAEQSAAAEQARQQIEASRQAWEEEVAKSRAELDEQAGQLQQQLAELETQRAQLQAERDEALRQRKQWEEEVSQHEDQRVRQVADFERRMAELEAGREALRAEQESWQAERQRQKAELAARDRQWEEASAALAARREQFEAARAAWDEERRRAEGETDLPEKPEGVSEEQAEEPAERTAEPADQEAPVGAPEGEAEQPAQEQPGQQEELTPPRPIVPASSISGPAWVAPDTDSGWTRPGPPKHDPRLRWVAALVAGILCSAAAGTATWYLQQAPVTAVAVLRLSEGEEWPLPQIPAGIDPIEEEEAMSAPEDLVKSYSVINAALAAYSVSELPMVRKAANPAAWLARTIGVDCFSQPGFMRISLNVDDPDAATTLLDAVVGVYVNRATSIIRARRVQRIGELAQKKSHADRALRRFQARLALETEPSEEEKTPEEKDGETSAAKDSEDAVDPAAERTRLEAEIKAKTELLRGGELPDPTEEDLTAALAVDAAAAKIGNEIEQLQQEEADLPKETFDERMQKLEEQRDERKKALQETLRQDQPKAMAKELARLKNELTLLAVQERKQAPASADSADRESTEEAPSGPFSLKTQIKQTEATIREIDAELQELQSKLSSTPIAVVQSATLQAGEGTSVRIALFLAALAVGFVLPTWLLAPRRESAPVKLAEWPMPKPQKPA